jgi:hypothetical protein
VFDTLLLISGVTITAVLSLAVVSYINRPLRKLLQELCGNPQRSDFWVAFSNVTVILLPVIFAMPSEPLSHAGPPSLPEICQQLKWGMAGLVTSVLVLGWILSRFIPKPAVRS